MRLVAWLILVGCATGCAAALDTSPATDLRTMGQASPPPTAQTHESADPAGGPIQQERVDAAPALLALGETDETPWRGRDPDPTRLSFAGETSRLSCFGVVASAGAVDEDRTCHLFETPLPTERPSGSDLPLRPPLRQFWFHHARLVPMGDDLEFGLPDGELLAHRDRVSSRPFRNTYAGLRDQPLLHRDSSRDPVTNSTLPELGPPPPHHAEKTVTVLIGGTLLGFAAYAFLPSSFTGTTKDGAVEEAWDHFKDAWTKPPVFDKDNALVNYLGHPYFGMSFYLSQRNFGETPLRSFLFSTVMSTAFEYFVESWAERPSIQDLIVTPIVGSILGELVFRATQEMRKDGFTTAEKIMVTVINPLYVLQNGYR